MALISGDFHFPGGGSLSLQPEARIHGGWGAQFATDVIGDERKPAPDRLDVLFYSYLEDKFYHGAFPLPRDSIARVLRDGYRSDRESSGRGTYDFLTVGIAPGGAVAVWASGADRETELFYGRAELVDLDWHSALGMPADVDRGETVRRELAAAAKSDPLVTRMLASTPIARLAEYRTRYQWRLVFEGVSTPNRPGALQFFNGERDVLAVSPDPARERAGRPVPRYLAFDDPQSPRSYEITFDDEETLAAFARAGAENRAVELVILGPRPGTDALTVRVRSGAADVTLRRVKADVFARS